MARYEVADGESHKFWEITLAGKTFTVRWGRLGSRGKSQVKHFGDAAEARREYDKLVGQKVRKGYKLVAGTEEAEVVAPAGTSAPIVYARSQELEAAVIADPNDEGALMVLGDWLQTQGDPRGELISLQHALKQAATDPKAFLERKRAAEDHYKRHEAGLLGALYPLRHLFKLEWQLGYIRGARLSLHARSGDDPDLVALLEQLVALPAAVALQELGLGHTGTLEAGYQDVVDAMCTSGRPAALRALVLGDYWPGMEEESGKLGRLAHLDTFAQLRKLVLNGTAVMGRVVLPELRHLELRASVDDRTFAWLDTKHLPKLEQLVFGDGAVWTGTRNRESDETRSLWRAARFPKLRTLRLGKSYILIEQLADADLLEQLETLDLGTIDEDDAGDLCERWGAFRHLKAVRATIEVEDSDGSAIIKRVRDRTTATVTVRRNYDS